MIKPVVRRSIALAAGAVVALALVSCGSSSAGADDTQSQPTTESQTSASGNGSGAGAQDGGTTSDAKSPTQVTIAAPSPSATFFFPLAIAMGNGCFADHGIDAKWETVAGVASVIQAMGSGQADVGAMDPSSLMRAKSLGQDIEGFFYYMPGGLFVFVVPAGSDIQGPDDLAGMTIGHRSADGGEIAFARNILKDSELAEGTDVEFLMVGDGGAAVAGFEHGDIDAYVGSVVDAAIMTAAGFEIRNITPQDSSIPASGGFYTTSTAFAQANPDVIQGMTTCFAEASEAAMGNPELVLEHAGKKNPEEVSDKELATALAKIGIEQTFPIGDPPMWGAIPAEYLESWHALYLETDVLENPIDDPTSVFDGRYVTEAHGDE